MTKFEKFGYKIVETLEQSQNVAVDADGETKLVSIDVASTGSTYITYSLTNGSRVALRLADHKASGMNSPVDYSTDKYRDALSYVKATLEHGTGSIHELISNGVKF
jgi:hypothetical protein